MKTPPVNVNFGDLPDSILQTFGGNVKFFLALIKGNESKAEPRALRSGLVADDVHLRRTETRTTMPMSVTREQMWKNVFHHTLAVPVSHVCHKNYTAVS